MRYVSPKTLEQQDMQSLLRLRDGCMQMRTKLSNQLRGLLSEYGAEGIGTITAVAVVSTMGNPNDFKNGRHFAAFLGLVPGQDSSGGRNRLLGITKRGNSYVRQLLIHGARSMVRCTDKKKDKRSMWVNQLKSRAGTNRTCVAVANKNARVVWALLKYQEAYRKAA
jgi:transposase